MAKFKIKYFAVEADEIEDNGGIIVAEDEEEFDSFADVLRNYDEEIIISIEREV
jgi:hypothetical protein